MEPGTIAAAARRGLTQIEVLVAAAIVGVLVALTLPAVQKVRDAAARADCQNRLRQAGLGVFGHEAARGVLPPGAAAGPNAELNIPAGAGHGLWAFVLPYLGDGPPASSYNFAIDYDAAGNRPAAGAAIKILLCPAGEFRPAPRGDGPPLGGCDYAPLEVNPFLADIAAIDPVGNFEGPLPANKRVRMTDITDGAANTILIAEAGGRPGAPWSSPLVPAGLRDVFAGAGGFHRTGSPVLMADGSSRFLSSGTELRVVARLATRAGGEGP